MGLVRRGLRVREHFDWPLCLCVVVIAIPAVLETKLDLHLASQEVACLGGDNGADCVVLLEGAEMEVVGHLEDDRVPLNGRGDRLIDYVHFLPRKRVWPREQRILHGYASDHRPLLVHYEVAAGRR